MLQDEDENEDKNQSFGSFWNLCMTNEPILQCIIVLRAWFVRHSLYLERTKKFVFRFVFVFVLAHEQPITIYIYFTYSSGNVSSERRQWGGNRKTQPTKPARTRVTSTVTGKQN